jgi:secreted Zn-dependent insulinase-like peptidase
VDGSRKKSFRKAEITSVYDLLTDEGQKTFLTWLLHSDYADEFKTDVVDGLLKDSTP